MLIMCNVLYCYYLLCYLCYNCLLSFSLLILIQCHRHFFFTARYLHFHKKQKLFHNVDPKSGSYKYWRRNDTFQKCASWWMGRFEFLSFQCTPWFGEIRTNFQSPGWYRNFYIKTHFLPIVENYPLKYFISSFFFYLL